MQDKVEDILMQLGKYGQWQILVFVCISIASNWAIVWQAFSISFVAPAHDYHCVVPQNLTREDCIPRESVDGTWVYSECQIYRNCTSEPGPGTVGCGSALGWEYEVEPFTRTITADWDLVCESDFFPSLAHTILIGGATLGSFILGPLADVYGRKPIFTISTIGAGIVGVCQAFMPNFWSFCIIQGLKGFVAIGGVSAGLTMSCELFPSDQRIYAGIWVQFFWATGLITLSGFAFFLRNWSFLLIGISVPLFLGISFIWIIPESIMWLIATGQVDRAKQTVLKAARFNGIPIDTEALHINDEEMNVNKEKRENKYTSPLAVFYAPVMRKYTFMIMYQNVAAQFAYWGLSFDSTNLAVDPYLGFFINGAVELPAILICLFTVPKWGRRPNLFVFHMISAVFILLVPFIPVQENPDLSALQLTITFIGKFSVSAAYLNLMFYMPEIYPTTHRGVGLGPTYLLGLIAGMVAPYILPLASDPSLFWLPNTIFAVLCAIGAVMALFMPETVNRPLAETIEDIQQWKLKVDKEDKLLYLQGMEMKRRNSEAKVQALMDQDPQYDGQRRKSSISIASILRIRRGSTATLDSQRRKDSRADLEATAGGGMRRTHTVEGDDMTALGEETALATVSGRLAVPASVHNRSASWSDAVTPFTRKTSNGMRPRPAAPEVDEEHPELRRTSVSSRKTSIVLPAVSVTMITDSVVEETIVTGDIDSDNHSVAKNIGNEASHGCNNDGFEDDTMVTRL